MRSGAEVEAERVDEGDLALTPRIEFQWEVTRRACIIKGWLLGDGDLHGDVACWDLSKDEKEVKSEQGFYFHASLLCG